MLLIKLLFYYFKVKTPTLRIRNLEMPRLIPYRLQTNGDGLVSRGREEGF